MLPYFILISVPMIFQHIKINKWKYAEKNLFSMKLFFFMLFCLVALRHSSIGKDTTTYIWYFEKISMSKTFIGLYFPYEMGFVLLNKIISIFTTNVQIYIIIIAFLTIYFIRKEYLRLCVDSTLTIILFCSMSTFIMMFSGIRQMIAISFGFLAYRFVREKKLLKFLIVTFIAMLFHNSAFMILFMYPLYHARITRKWLLVVIPILIIVFIYKNLVFNLLTSILSSYTRFDVSSSSTGAYTMLLLFFLFGIYSYIIPDEKKLSDEIIGLRNFCLMSICIQIFAPLHVLAMRMNYYYIIFIPLLVPLIIKNSSLKWKKVAVLSRYVLVFFFLIYFFVSAETGDSLNIFPYHFFWEVI